MRNQLIALVLSTTALAAPLRAQPVPPDAAAIAALQAQVDALQAQIDGLKKQVGQEAPSWKGAPEFAGEGGFEFKPKGFAQFDAGYVATPGAPMSGTVGGLNYQNLGWNTRARRIVFGAEGTLPGGFGYKVEFNFAQGAVDYQEVALAYQRPGSTLQFTIGNLTALSSLDRMTSSRVQSFLERAAFTDAFGSGRRLGFTVGLADPGDRYSLTAGIFSQEINNDSLARTGWQTSVRGIVSPQLGDVKAHVGANFQHRVAQRDAQNVRYRARPFTQLTDQRFVDTGAIAADGDDVLGVELAAIRGPLHIAAEAQKLWVRGYRPSRTFGPNNGVAGAAFYGSDPSFWSAYGEVGFYLTGETRGYRNGRWDRTKVRERFDKGGIGAIQLNARLDHLDLSDATAKGATLAAPNYVNGGRQTGYELSLIWNPIDYIRFQAQYARVEIDGGPRADTIVPGAEFTLDKDYGFDTFGMRAQVEF